MRNILALAGTAFFILAPAVPAQQCAAGYMVNAGSNENRFLVCDPSVAYFVDDFPCKNVEDGEIGNLGWQLINTVTGTSCGNGVAGQTGFQSLIPSAGNTPSGITLARSSATGSGLVADPSTTAWAFQARIKLVDLDEIVVKVGVGDEVATESIDHAASGQDFIGVIFKDEDSDSASECGGVTGDSANWQFHSVKAGVSAGLQDSGVAATTNTWLWIRAHSSLTGVQVCVQSTNGAPTPASGAPEAGAAVGTCYTETDSANIPVVNVAPFIAISSCDNSSVSGNANRVDVDYMGLVVSRY